MPGPRQFKAATLKSAIKVVQAAGLNIIGAEITADGTVRVLTGAGQPIEEPNLADLALERLRAKRRLEQETGCGKRPRVRPKGQS